MSVNPNKVAGRDKLKPWVLKELADAMAQMVTLIYNASKTQQKVPRDCLGPIHSYNKAASQLEMVQCQAGRRVKNNYVQQSSVTQMLIDLKVAGPGPETNKCETH